MTICVNARQAMKDHKMNQNDFFIHGNQLFIMHNMLPAIPVNENDRYH